MKIIEYILKTMDCSGWELIESEGSSWLQKELHRGLFAMIAVRQWQWCTVLLCGFWDLGFDFRGQVRKAGTEIKFFNPMVISGSAGLDACDVDALGACDLVERSARTIAHFLKCPYTHLWGYAGELYLRNKMRTFDSVLEWDRFDTGIREYVLVFQRLPAFISSDLGRLRRFMKHLPEKERNERYWKYRRLRKRLEIAQAFV